MNCLSFLRKNIVVLIGGFLILGIGILLCFRNYEKNNENQLIVGVMSGYPPFAQINEQGDLVGFDIDVAKVLACKLGRTSVIKDMNLAALLISLQQNKVDLVLSGLSITSERKQSMTMIYYQGKPTTTYPLVFWKEIPKNIETLNDLKLYPDAVVCVEPGSVQEKFLLMFDFLTLRQISNPVDIIMDLKYGKSLAAVFDPDILPLFQQKNPELKVLDLELPLMYQSQGCGIAVNKNNTDLARQITTVIDVMTKKGVLASLEEKWFRTKEGSFND